MESPPTAAANSPRQRGLSNARAEKHRWLRTAVRQERGRRRRRGQALQRPDDGALGHRRYRKHRWRRHRNRTGRTRRNFLYVAHRALRHGDEVRRGGLCRHVSRSRCLGQIRRRADVLPPKWRRRIRPRARQVAGARVRRVRRSGCIRDWKRGAGQFHGCRACRQLRGSDVDHRHRGRSARGHSRHRRDPADRRRRREARPGDDRALSGAALLIIVINIAEVPAAIGLIFTHAFTPAAAAGGFAGAAVAAAIRFGVARGVFSNELGLGSAAIAHAAAQTNSPVRQGIIAMLGTCIDTLVVCTMTALVILTSGAWTMTGADGGGLTGVVLTSAGFQSTMAGGSTSSPSRSRSSPLRPSSGGRTTASGAGSTSSARRVSWCIERSGSWRRFRSRM